MPNSKASDANEAGTDAENPPITAEERAGLSDKGLAKAVLDRRLRPRVSEVRRLAEAVLAGGKKEKRRKADRPDQESGRKDGKKAAKTKGGGSGKKKKDKGRRKLATIPAAPQDS